MRLYTINWDTGETTEFMDGFVEWAKVADMGHNKVEFTEVTRDICISTVFLGIDHSFGDEDPVLFETMIFGGEFDQQMTRTSTLEEAKSCHADAVSFVREHMKAVAITERLRLSD